MSTFNLIVFYRTGYRMFLMIRKARDPPTLLVPGIQRLLLLLSVLSVMPICEPNMSLCPEVMRLRQYHVPFVRNRSSLNFWKTMKIGCGKMQQRKMIRYCILDLS